MKLTESIHHYLDGARGQYIPRDFANETKPEYIEGASAEDLEYLKRGPGGVLDNERLYFIPLAEGETVRGDHYWDVWQDVLDNAIVIDPESGLRFKLWNGESGDIFLVPEDWEWNDETGTFERPESDTLRRFDLPAYWASFLINGDGSGLQEGEEKQIEAFLAKEGLENWQCADCSDESHFAHSNDATTLGGDVLRYTFVNHHAVHATTTS